MDSRPPPRGADDTGPSTAVTMPTGEDIARALRVVSGAAPSTAVTPAQARSAPAGAPDVVRPLVSTDVTWGQGAEPEPRRSPFKMGIAVGAIVSIAAVAVVIVGLRSSSLVKAPASSTPPPSAEEAAPGRLAAPAPPPPPQDPPAAPSVVVAETVVSPSSLPAATVAPSVRPRPPGRGRATTPATTATPPAGSRACGAARAGGDASTERRANPALASATKRASYEIEIRRGPKAHICGWLGREPQIRRGPKAHLCGWLGREPQIRRGPKAHLCGWLGREPPCRQRRRPTSAGGWGASPKFDERRRPTSAGGWGASPKFIAAAVFAGLVFAAPFAHADAQSEADALITKGVGLREKGRDEEALDVFRQALAKSPSARARAQVALAEQALGMWVLAETICPRRSRPRAIRGSRRTAARSRERSPSSRSASRRSRSVAPSRPTSMSMASGSGPVVDRSASKRAGARSRSAGRASTRPLAPSSCRPAVSHARR